MLTLPMCGMLAASWPPAPIMGSEPVEEACFFGDLDIGGRIARVSPNPGIANRVELSRLRMETAFHASERWTVRMSMTPVRSAPETGYIGVGGESLLWRLQVAEARLTVAELGLTLTAGLIDDPWMLSSNIAWGWITTAPTLSQANGWFDRSDQGVAALWRAPKGFFDAQVMLTTGEGANLRERNNGKNLTAMVVGRPLAGLDKANMLEVSVLVRDGSKGVELARDHRLAARIASRGKGYSTGVEFIQSSGVGGDPDQTPWGVSAWGTVDPYGPLTVFARYDNVDRVPGTDGTTAGTLHAGIGVRETNPGRDGRLFLGVQRRTWGSAVAPVAGTAASETVIYLQLAGRVRAGVPVELGTNGPPEP